MDFKAFKVIECGNEPAYGYKVSYDSDAITKNPNPEILIKVWKVVSHMFIPARDKPNLPNHILC